MYLLYLDESGNEDDPNDKYFVLAGAALFERQTFFLSQELDQLQTRYFPGVQPIAFHSTDMRTGKGFWRNVHEDVRNDLLMEIAKVISSANRPGMVLFAAVIEKSDQLYGEKAVEYATEQVCKRFDTFLVRQYQDENNPQRGLIIFSEGRFDKRAKVWVRGFKNLGTQWGAINNLSDIPYFASMKDTRLLQMADFIAYSVYQLYQRREPQYIRSLLHRFHQRDGVIHGLVHYRDRTKITYGCDCPACASRKTPSNWGSWM